VSLDFSGAGSIQPLADSISLAASQGFGGGELRTCKWVRNRAISLSNGTVGRFAQPDLRSTKNRVDGQPYRN